MRQDAGISPARTVGLDFKVFVMTVARSILLFVLAAIAEIGGAWLIWQGVREHRGWIWMGAGVVALGVYGFVATLQPDAQFGRPPTAASSSRAPCSGEWRWTVTVPIGGTSPEPSSVWPASASSCTPPEGPDSALSTVTRLRGEVAGAAPFDWVSTPWTASPSWRCHFPPQHHPPGRASLRGQKPPHQVMFVRVRRCSLRVICSTESTGALGSHH